MSHNPAIEEGLLNDHERCSLTGEGLDFAELLVNFGDAGDIVAALRAAMEADSEILVEIIH